MIFKNVFVLKKVYNFVSNMLHIFSLGIFSAFIRNQTVYSSFLQCLMKTVHALSAVNICYNMLLNRILSVNSSCH